MFSISDLEKYAYVNNEAEPWTYTLTEDRVGPVPGRLFRTSYETSGQNYAEEGEYIVNIEENTFELPSTGGRGTGMFYILGSILTVLAAVLLIAKKRSDAAGID